MCLTLAASSSLGVWLSVATALLWAFSPLCWSSAGRRIGSYPVTALRSAVAAMLFLGLLPLYWRFGHASISVPSGWQILWLAISSLSGMVIGDVLLVESYLLIGPRRGVQILTLAPVASVILAWLWLGESLSVLPLLGIGLVLASTSYAVFRNPASMRSDSDAERGEADAEEPEAELSEDLPTYGGGDAATESEAVAVATLPREASRSTHRISPLGVLMAILGSILVGLGAVTVRQAYRAGPLDPVLAATIRVGGSAVFLLILPIVRGESVRLFSHLRDAHILTRLIPGVVAGPFVGMICYILALKHLDAGVVSTLTSLSPVFVLPMIAYRYRVRIGLDLLVASLLATGGVALICLR